MYIVADDPEALPPLSRIVSNGRDADVDEKAELRMPSEKDMQIVSSRRAAQIFGTSALRLDGVTVSGISLR